MTSRVLRHRHDHLAVVLRLGLLAALELDSRQLRDAFDERRDVVAELGADFLDRRGRVLDDVVDEAGGEGGLVAPELRQDLRHSDRVEDEVLPAPALLAFVRLAGEPVRALEQVPIDLGVVLLDLREQLLERLVMPLGGSCQNRIRHEPILAGGDFRNYLCRQGHRLLQSSEEGLRLDERAPRAAVHDAELGEDAAGELRPLLRARLPLRDERERAGPRSARACRRSA